MKNWFLNCWDKFWLLRNRCPKCFKKLLHYSDYGQDYSYCENCMDKAYFDDFTMVEFRD